MRFWKWEFGRSGGGYKKLTLFDQNFPIRWDSHILYMPLGSSVEAHSDPIRGMDHWRMNIILLSPKKGGDFCCEGNPFLDFKRFKIFRPDLQQHYVTPVESGARICLSIGWALRRK